MIFHKVVQQKQTLGVVGCLMNVLLHIVSWFWQWTNFENRVIFDKFKAYKIIVPFLGHAVYKKYPSRI